MSESTPNRLEEAKSRMGELAVLAVNGAASQENLHELDEILIANPDLQSDYFELCLSGTLARKLTSAVQGTFEIPQRVAAERLPKPKKPSKQCMEIVRQKEATSASQDYTPKAFHAYFVVDLAGDPKMVANLQKAFESLGDILDISDAYDIGRFSLITYNNVAQTAVPSCSPREFQVPNLVAHRSSKHSLGAAYELLAEERQKEVKPGDSGAMVFTLLNGTPTDDWEQSANRVKKLFGPYSIMIDQSGDVHASEMLKATRFKEVYRMKGSETKDYDNLIKTLGSTIDQTSTRNTSMGHTIQAEENEPAKATEPVLSIIGDTLLPL